MKANELTHFTGIWGPHRNLLWQVTKQTCTFYDGSIPLVIFTMCFRHQHTSYVQLIAYVCMINQPWSYIQLRDRIWEEKFHFVYAINFYTEIWASIYTWCMYYHLSHPICGNYNLDDLPLDPRVSGPLLIFHLKLFAMLPASTAKETLEIVMSLFKWLS